MKNTEEIASIAVRSRPAIATDSRYEVRIAASRHEIDSALRLRHEVFCSELGNGAEKACGLEFDEFDELYDHLIVIERASRQTVGTYRLSTIEMVGGVGGFYSNREFAIETLPSEVVRRGIEIGRACISQEHRNTKVLFLLWRGLADCLKMRRKDFLFGCCSIFSRDPSFGEAAFKHLAASGQIHETIMIEPRAVSATTPSDLEYSDSNVELPPLFKTYLRMGARVCSRPLFDRDFGTIDFLVLFDLNRIDDRYRKMFFE